MKSTFSVLFLGLFLFNNSCKTNEVIRHPELFNDLLFQRNFFALRDSLDKFDGPGFRIHKAAVLNAFYRPAESNMILKDFLENETNDSIRTEAYKIKLANHILLYEYRKAAETIQSILDRFRSRLPDQEISDFENQFRIWDALREISPQNVEIKGETTIDLIPNKNSIGLLPIKGFGLGFDTGANISLINQTVSDSLKANILRNDIEVGTISDVKVLAKIGVVENFYLGDILIKNAIFLVMDDRDLTFGDFKLYGVIGFPIISALGEVRIIKKNKLVISSHISPCEFQNLFLDGLQPVALVKENNMFMNFTFDSGAGTTHLYSNYFNHNRDRITKYGEEQIDSLMGVGGVSVTRSYMLDSLNLGIGSSTATLRNIQVLTSGLRDFEKYYFGNLGLDYLANFDEILLNFKYMCVDYK